MAPGLLAGVVFAGILAAIMSTADSFLNLAAAALVRDLPQALGRRPRNQLESARLAVVGTALAAALVSHLYGDLIALLGTFAFSTSAAALAPTLAIGLNWKRVPARAALASIATGLVLNVGLEFLAHQTWLPSWSGPPFPPDVLPGAVSLAASFGVLLALTWTSEEVERLPEDVEAVLDC